jgi:hypothetical protein
VQLGGKEKHIINQESKEVSIPPNIMVGSSGVRVLTASVFALYSSILINLRYLMFRSLIDMLHCYCVLNNSKPEVKGVKSVYSGFFLQPNFCNKAIS